MFPWEDTRDGSKIKSSIVYFHLISLLRLTLELFRIRNVKQMCAFCSACTIISYLCLLQIESVFSVKEGLLDDLVVDLESNGPFLSKTLVKVNITSTFKYISWDHFMILVLVPITGRLFLLIQLSNL